MHEPCQQVDLTQQHACWRHLPVCRQRVAASLLDRTIQLFSSSGTRLDKFKTKAASETSSNYLITALAWSPSSELLAVGQSDNAAFVYRLDKSGKKSICNKILFSAAVCQLCWLPDSPQAVLCGCVDGKVCSKNLQSDACLHLRYLAPAQPMQACLSDSAPGQTSMHLQCQQTPARCRSELLPWSLTRGPLCTRLSR